METLPLVLQLKPGRKFLCTQIEKETKINLFETCYTLALGSLDLIDLNAENAAVPPPINR